MARGLKQTSSMIEISTSSTSTSAAADVFTSKRIDLQLNPLDNEVFVVTGIKIDFDRPLLEGNIALVGAQEAAQRCSLSTTEQTTYQGISNPNVMGASQVSVLFDPATGNYTALEQSPMDAPPTSMDYLTVIATNDFFVNYFLGANYIIGQDAGVQIRVYGYRAKADASTYAALVQSELLSS